MQGRIDPEDVSEFDRYLVLETTAARGSIIGSYARVEFTLADFAIKSTARAELASLAGPFPYGKEARLRAVLKILKKEPFRRYREAATPLVREIDRWKKLRDMMAHGFLTIEVSDRAEHALLFRLWEPFGKGNAQLRHYHSTLPVLVGEAAAAAAYAHNFVSLFRRIYIEQKIDGDI